MALDTGWSTSTEEGRWTVRVHGELDIDTGPRLREFIADELTRCDAPELAVDLTDLSFCDSSGLGALAASMRRARAADRRFLLILDKDSRTHRLLELAGLLDVFEVERPALQGSAAGAEQAHTAAQSGSSAT